jgi:hypothetical protein
MQRKKRDAGYLGESGKMVRGEKRDKAIKGSVKGVDKKADQHYLATPTCNS